MKRLIFSSLIIAGLSTERFRANGDGSGLLPPRPAPRRR